MSFIKFILLIILLNMITCIIFASQNDEYSYAAGVNNEVEINWGLNLQGDDLLGCNLFRYDSLSTIYSQVNNNLILSSNNTFMFTDTQNINDTIDYKYEIEFVYEDTSYTQTFPLFALKRIDFELQSDEEINVILEFRKNYGYDGKVLVSWDNIVWSTMTQTYINQTDTLLINPYQFQTYWGNYLLVEFQDWSLIDPFIGNLKFSMDFLIEVIENTNIEENIIYPNKIDITCWNYPNPFNPSTTINFDLHKNVSDLIIEIFNIKGECIREL